MVTACVAQLKKNKEEINREFMRKPSESFINYPIITSKSLLGG